MALPILATKLYIPPSRRKVVVRRRLIERLDEGLASGCKLTLISAPAGFGKTRLVSEWVAGCGRPVAWLSLDKGDNDPTRFLIYLIAALQTILPNVGAGMLGALESSPPPSAEAVLTALLNEINATSGGQAPSESESHGFILVLDDYHLIEAKLIDNALLFMIEHLPPELHPVIATREDPSFPLARLRGSGQLNELRAADLRFTTAEAAEFLNQAMGLNLSAEDIALLEARTEGWIAGLQLAAISMLGHQDTAAFIKSFTGSHHFVLDYLLEEVLQQQSESVQTFLLHTSILERLCGPLCDAVLRDPLVSGQETLEYLERANLFIVSLDDERRWYRYHHLFADLLRQRLHRLTASSPGVEGKRIAELHIRASQWFEEHGLEIEAFQHAAAANDIERAERLIQAGGMPVYSLAVVTSIIAWLDSLPRTVLDARPWLWVRSATAQLMSGQTTGVEEKLQAAEKVMQNADPDDMTRDLMGQIAAVRATLALVQYRTDATIIQARRALEYLLPTNLAFRSRAMWTLGCAYKLQGDRAAARQVLAGAIQQASGNIYYTILASTSFGQLQESENELCQAAETYKSSLQLMSVQGPPSASEEYIGLARIFYEWNDPDTAEEYGQKSLALARQYDSTIDRFVGCQVFLARLKLARGEVDEAAAILADAERSVRQQNFVHRIPDVAAAQVLTLLRRGDVATAARIAGMHELPMSQARVALAQGDAAKALAVLEPLRRQAEAKCWADERLGTMVLQAVALHAHEEKEKAVQLLGEALALAEPGGFIRIFVDEGEPMHLLLLDFRSWLAKHAQQGHTLIAYADKLLAAFAQTATLPQSQPSNQKAAPVEPLSQRELQIVQLIAQGLSNREIGERLFLALDTVKGHNRNIFDKLQVSSRTEAIARARELGLL